VDPGKVYGHTIPIGKPFSNTRVYILNSDLKLCPVGVPGQLYIAGDGVARGYFNKADLTNEKFIDDPFNEESSSKMYSTGDLVKYLPDGNIEFIGRVDDQVKIRGYRIELGEIEAVLQQCEIVSQAVVLAREDKQSNKRLVAYVVTNGWFNKEEVISYLKDKIPDYMIPVVIVELAKLPLTANGKVDRKALPDPDIAEGLIDQYVAPRNEVETKLAGIWQDVLDVEKVGIYDNFFELGGDSIISIQVVSRARRGGCEFQVGDVFTYQTIASLVEYLENKSETMADVSGEQLMLKGTVGLLPVQQWYFEKQLVEISHFNQSVLLTIDKIVTETILRTAAEQLTMHHDALRFRYHQNEGVWQQEYGSSKGVLITIDLHTVLHDFGPILNEQADGIQRSLKLEKGELIKFVLFGTPGYEVNNRLLIVIHHLAVDGVSWRILLEDLELLLTKLKNGESIDLGKKSTSYRQWYDSLEKYGQSHALLSQTKYWEHTVKSHQSLPVDKEYDGVVKQKDKGLHVVRLGAVQTRRLLQDVPRAYHTEINDLLLSALAKTMYEWSDQDKVMIGLEGHGREVIAEGIDTSRTVGWFTTHYPLLLEVASAKTEEDLIKSVKEQLRRVPDKGVGYGVLKYINKHEAFKGTQPWDIIFNYLGQLDNVVKKSKWLAVAGEPAGADTSEEYSVSEKLWVNCSVREEELVFNWTFSNRHFNEETIHNLSKAYLFNLESLIEHCIRKLSLGESVFTPADFGLGSDINYTELDTFLNESFNGKTRKESLESIYRLSGLQQGMLFHGLYDGGGTGYINQFCCDILNPQVELLKKSWNHLLRSHTILRSAFYHDSFSIPVQCVYKEIKLPIEVIDYRRLTKSDQITAIKQFEEADRAIGFDFKSCPLMRISFLRLDENRYSMLWSFHHILFDGWSRSIMMGEFLKIYKSLVSGERLPGIAQD
ncbi:MAG: AMP-binding protein, partial [Bacteroidetes bacterium]|nr:AMP-binding protein [Bacteroidota bacterium]